MTKNQSFVLKISVIYSFIFLNCNGEPTQEKVNSIAEKILKDMENREENEKLYLKEVEEKNATEN